MAEASETTFEIYTPRGMVPRSGLRFTHTLLGTPVEFGFRVEFVRNTEGDARRVLVNEDPQDAEQSSLDVSEVDRLGYLTHIPTGFGVVFVNVPRGATAIGCSRLVLDALPDEAKAALRDDALALPGASVEERAAAMVLGCNRGVRDLSRAQLLAAKGASHG